MKEIKFRACAKKGGRSFPADGVFRYWSAFELPLSVVKETIGQFTGLKDKNGKEIFEGDIVQAPDGRWEVEARDLEDGVVLSDDVRDECSVNYVDGDYSLTECSVIGNIHENPELLKTN